MGMKNSKTVYSLEDVNKAFAMGLESAIVVLEKSIGLSIDGRHRMIDLLKQRIQQYKVEAAMGEGAHF